jgi:hypothetical protein
MNVKVNGINMYEGTFLNLCRSKHIVTTLLEDGTLDILEEEGHNNSFIPGTGYEDVMKTYGGVDV